MAAEPVRNRFIDVILLISIACVEETLASSYNTFADIHTI